METLRRQYGRLEVAEETRIAAAKASEEAKKRRVKWEAYGCSSEPVMGEHGCVFGDRVVFAPHTPDEKVLVEPPKTACLKQWPKGEEERKACETYAAAFLRTKGVAEEDITPILGQFYSRDLIRQINRSAGAGPIEVR